MEKKIFCYPIGPVLLRIADCQGPLTFKKILDCHKRLPYMDNQKDILLFDPEPKDFGP